MEKVCILTPIEKVYIVTAGEYSDYHIVGVYSSKENAKMVKNKINKNSDWDWADIEVWQVDRGIEELKKHKSIYYVELNKRGDVIEVEKCWDDFAFRGVDVFESSISGNLHTYVWANTKEEAVKIASERRTKYLVEKEEKDKK